MNIDEIAVLVGGHRFAEVSPPGIQQPFLANETEPRRKEQFGVLHHINQSLSSDPLVSVHLIRMWLDGKFRFVFDTEEEDVINFMFTPRTDYYFLQMLEADQ